MPIQPMTPAIIADGGVIIMSRFSDCNRGCIDSLIFPTSNFPAGISSIRLTTNMTPMNTIKSILIAAFLSQGCGGKNTDFNVEAPGRERTGESKVLDAGADLLQNKRPLNKMSTYLDGFHFYNGNMDAQMEAHHYVSQLTVDVHQAIIRDGNGDDAKIMGVEYIISERICKTLDEEEKKLWHSHHYEVKSGTLIVPGIPDIAEHELMEKLVSTYSKTIHTWHTDQDFELPIGSPMVMMGVHA